MRGHRYAGSDRSVDSGIGSVLVRTYVCMPGDDRQANKSMVRPTRLAQCCLSVTVPKTDTQTGSPINDCHLITTNNTRTHFTTNNVTNAVSCTKLNNDWLASAFALAYNTHRRRHAQEGYFLHLLTIHATARAEQRPTALLTAKSWRAARRWRSGYGRETPWKQIVVLGNASFVGSALEWLLRRNVGGERRMGTAITDSGGHDREMLQPESTMAAGPSHSERSIGRPTDNRRKRKMGILTETLSQARQSATCATANGRFSSLSRMYTRTAVSSHESDSVSPG